MFMGKYARKAVALAGVLAVALIGATTVGLWAGAVGPASTSAALVDPAAAMDLDAGICIGDPVEALGSATPPDLGLALDPCLGCGPVLGCRFVGCDAVCCFYTCGGGPICAPRIPPVPTDP